jgi:hypothetical protein
MSVKTLSSDNIKISPIENIKSFINYFEEFHTTNNIYQFIDKDRITKVNYSTNNM